MLSDFLVNSIEVFANISTIVMFEALKLIAKFLILSFVETAQRFRGRLDKV